MAIGTMVLLVIALVVLRSTGKQGPAEHLALKAKRVDLVDRMRLTLASALT